MPPVGEVKNLALLVFLFLSAPSFSVGQKAMEEVLDLQDTPELSPSHLCHTLPLVLSTLFPSISGCCGFSTVSCKCHLSLKTLSYLVPSSESAISVLGSVPLWPLALLLPTIFHMLGVSSSCSVNSCFFPETHLNSLLCGHHLAMPSMCRLHKEIKMNQFIVSPVLNV